MPATISSTAAAAAPRIKGSLFLSEALGADAGAALGGSGLAARGLDGGSAFGGVKGRTQLPGYVDRYMQGAIRIDEMISEVLPLSEINKAFDLMHEGKVIRSVIRF